MTAEKLFKLLGNKIRLRLLCLLRERDLRVGDLQEITGLPMATVSKDLMRMRRLKLVVAKRRGISITYSLPKNEEAEILLEVLHAAQKSLPLEVLADAIALKSHTPSAFPQTLAEEKQFLGNTSRERKPAKRGKTGQVNPPPKSKKPDEAHFGSLPTNLL